MPTLPARRLGLNRFSSMSYVDSGRIKWFRGSLTTQDCDLSWTARHHERIVPLEIRIFADIVPLVEGVEVQNRADGKICFWAGTDQVDFVVDHQGCPTINLVLELRDFFLIELRRI